MGRLIFIFVLLLCSTLSYGAYNPKTGKDHIFKTKEYPKNEIFKYVDKWSGHFGVPHFVIKAVIEQESSFGHWRVSHIGATGLMQVRPSTARWLGMEDEESLFNPYTNIYYGTKYLKMLFQEYGDWKTSFMAYYAGPGRVKQHQAGELSRELYWKIRRYSEQVMRRCYKYMEMKDIAAP